MIAIGYYEVLFIIIIIIIIVIVIVIIIIASFFKFDFRFFTNISLQNWRELVNC